MGKEKADNLPAITMDELVTMVNESTNEFVIVSTDGYIRTYFKPSDGIEYFKRQ